MAEEGPGGAPAWSEVDRLAALARYGVLDTPSERDYDDIVHLAGQICGTPIALISLLDQDRQWFKARLGLDVSETPRAIAFCDRAIARHGVFEVPDAARDPRFADNPLVTGEPRIGFYAGAPILTPEGLPLGTLCVLDQEPRSLSDEQRSALEALARQVMTLLELRRTLAEQRSERRRSHQILESAVDYAIIAMDLSGLVTSWNEGARRIFGWSRDEMCGQPCDAFFTQQDRDADVPRLEIESALRIGRGRDERWHLRKNGQCIWANGEMMPLTDEDDLPIGFIKIIRDRTTERLTREREEELRELLTNELKHRIKNTLSVVQAIVSQSLRTVATPAEAREAIGDRLATLARAHDLLTQTSWSAAPMTSIIEGAAAVLGHRNGQVAIGGPDIRLNARAALALSMAIHELSTNAAKYGALSNEAGIIDVSWTVRTTGDDDFIDLVWQESGGPLVKPPTREGFGSKLIGASLARDLGGRGVADYLPTGVRWTLAARRSTIEDA